MNAININVDIDVDDVISEISDDVILDEFNDRNLLNSDELHKFFQTDELIDAIVNKYNILDAERIRGFFEELDRS